MKKGISFYFGYNIPAEERIKLLSRYGFDCCISTADKRFNKQNGKISKQIKLYKKYNISPSSLHMQYDDGGLHYFWEKGKIGETQKKLLIKDVKTAKKYGFNCTVVHLFGEYSNIGEKRLLDVLKVCKKLDIPLAIENTNSQKLFIDVFDRIDNQYLRFCYDCGHNNLFDKDFNYLEKYGDKLIALHLHDNDGVSDMHTLNKYGTINWEQIAKDLAFKDVNLDYEIMLREKPNIDINECLKIVKKQADELEGRINYYQNNKI